MTVDSRQLRVKMVPVLTVNCKLWTVNSLNYLSLTGHKFHAPKGIGALYLRRKAPFSAYVHGGHQERNRRGGTENVPLIVGMGRAAELARKRLPV